MSNRNIAASAAAVSFLLLSMPVYSVPTEIYNGFGNLTKTKMKTQIASFADRNHKPPFQLIGPIVTSRNRRQ